MSFFRKRFGSKNRKAFNLNIETRQTVDETTTEEKYETYDKKKEHEAELWADLLIKEPLLEYNKENAERLKVNYVAEKDTNYKKMKDCFYIIQVLRRLLPDKTMTVCTHNNKVRLSTLDGKTPRESRTKNALVWLHRECRHPRLVGVKIILSGFLTWLSNTTIDTNTDSLKKALKKLKPGDLLYSLREQCINKLLCDASTNYLGYNAKDCWLTSEILTLELMTRHIS